MATVAEVTFRVSYRRKVVDTCVKLPSKVILLGRLPPQINKALQAALPKLSQLPPECLSWLAGPIPQQFVQDKTDTGGRELVDLLRP